MVPMNIAHTVFFLSILCSSSLASGAQAPANAAPAPAAPPVPAAPAAPSTLLQPSLDQVKQTLGALNLDRWKRGSIREEAARDIGAILQDLQENLPPLVKDADAAPGSLSKVLPLSRHVDALYDVVLRVEEAARVTAPVEQVDQLQSSLTNLGNARLALDKQLLDTASAQEQQLAELHKTVQAQANLKCPAPVAPKPVPCVKPTPRRTVKRKPKAPAATQQKAPATTATPQK